MRITEIHHPEIHQALKDEAFVRAEKEALEWQELMEELGKEQLPAKILVDWEEPEIEESIDIERYI